MKRRALHMQNRCKGGLKMNQQRQNELYHELIRWVFEQCRSREQLFYVLCERIGMTQEELHDSGIRELDRFFK